MTTLLYIRASVRGAEGHSTILGERFVDRWSRAHPHGRVVVRDLVNDPVPYLDVERWAAFTTPEDNRTPDQRAIIAESDLLIDELRQADEIAFAMPMYNFAVPAQVKTYFDHIARAGVTFRYTDQGPVGMIENKPLHFLCARGGLYGEYGVDHQTPFLRDFFEMLGLTDLRFVTAQGLNIDTAMREESMAAALAEIDRLFAEASVLEG